MKDKIIITAPLPPPIHGMSLATKMLIEGDTDKKFIIIDTAMDKTTIAYQQPSIFNPKRFLKIISKLVTDSFKMLFSSYKAHYLCVGMDYRGIVRYLPYIILSRLKRKPYIIHVHNGAFGRLYKSLEGNKRRVVRFMFSNAATVIVLGDSLKNMFDGVVDKRKITVVENCVADEYFATPETIKEKINRSYNPIKVLYLSNLMEDKGIFDLMDAMAMTDNCELHIGGAIENRESTRKRVEELLKKHNDKFFYYGIVSGDVKRKLLNECVIFALPSRNEGQPISILEAYANGMAVVTDETCGGIGDIFKDGVNGYTCTPTVPESIKKAIEKCSDSLHLFIEPNYNYAQVNFKRANFIAKINGLFDKI